MRRVALIVIPVIVVLVVIVYLQVIPGDSTEDVNVTEVEEQDLSTCRNDSDCIVVPYEHCCGSTKRAINEKYLNIYNSNPEWQVYNGSCHLMGVCADDSYVTEAICEKQDDVMRCELKY